MNSKRLRDLLGRLTHPTGADLLAYTDGELPGRKSAQVRAHLQRCWRCRLELGKAESAIGVFMEIRDAEVERFPPPGGWSRFPALLRSAAGEKVERKKVRRAYGGTSWLKLAFASAAFAAAAIWFLFATVKPISANTLLSHAVMSEIREVRGVREPVLYQNIQVRFTASSRQGEQIGAVESWTELGGSRRRWRSEAAFWPDLERVLRQNHMDGRPLLAASAFREWRKSSAIRREQVSRGKLQDGTEALTLQTVAAAPGRDSILEASLVVRAGDWRPVEQRLRVRGESDIREYKLVELSAGISPLSALDSSVFGTAAPPGPAPAITKNEPPAVPAGPALDISIETEVAALYALHQARACLGEAVEVTRGPTGRVLVEGMVETQQRKEEIVAALLPVQAAETRIKSIAELPAPAPGIVAAATPLAAESSTGSPAAIEEPPIQQALKGRASASRITELSNRAVSLSEHWMADAWALRKLTERFPQDRLKRLSESGRELLAEMVRRHSADLASKLMECQTAFRPYLDGASGAPVPEGIELGWPGLAQEVFQTATSTADLIRALCTSSGEPGVLGTDAILKVPAALDAARNRADLLSHGLDAPVLSRRGLENVPAKEE